MAEFLIWPALFAYSRGGGRARRRRFGTRGSRAGSRSGASGSAGSRRRRCSSPRRRRPTPSRGRRWAGALNLLSWLVVSVYLVWGCRASFRLLGLAVTPVAAVLLGAAWAGGGTGAEGDHPGVLLATHVSLMLAGFAAFALAAGLAGLYLWQERRLKRREPTLLRLRIPPLETLDRLEARTLVAGLVTLTVGILVGIASLAVDGGSVDAAMAATLGAWVVYAGYVVFRLRGLQGRRAACTRSRRSRPSSSSSPSPTSRHEAGPRRHLAPPRARRAPGTGRARPRAGGRGGGAACRRRRGGGRPLDLQPHRGVRRAPGRGRGGDDRDDAVRRPRAVAGALPAARRGRGPAPLPRRRRPRLDGARRGRDPRAGAGRVRGRLGRARARSPVPPGAARGQEGAHAHGDRREPGVRLGRRGRARTVRVR